MDTAGSLPLFIECGRRRCSPAQRGSVPARTRQLRCPALGLRRAIVPSTTSSRCVKRSCSHNSKQVIAGNCACERTAPMCMAYAVVMPVPTICSQNGFVKRSTQRIDSPRPRCAASDDKPARAASVQARFVKVFDDPFFLPLPVDARHLRYLCRGSKGFRSMRR